METPKKKREDSKLETRTSGDREKKIYTCFRFTLKTGRSISRLAGWASTIILSDPLA